MLMTMTMIEQRTWPVANLRPNPLNPRGEIDETTLGELVASIREQGVLQPLLVTPDGIVIAGHRRLAAARQAGLARVPVIVRELSETEQLTIMLTENVQREDLTPIQEARAYARLRDGGMTMADIARTVGVQVNRVRTRLVLLKLVPEVQELFDRLELPITLAEPLSKVHDPHAQRNLALMAMRRRLTVPQLEQMIARSCGVAVQPQPQKAERARSWIGISRREAMELLRREPRRSVTYQDVLALFDDVCGVCGSCGMARLDVVCRECPLPQFVARLTR